MKAAAVVLLIVPVLFAADTVPADHAKDYVGKTATVCGKVGSTRYLENSERKLTFLNFGKPYRNHDFTAIVDGENRAKFGKPEEQYLQKDVCVTGAIKDFNGKPEIELTDPKQIRLESR